jgi:hypothetical protein
MQTDVGTAGEDRYTHMPCSAVSVSVPRCTRKSMLMFIYTFIFMFMLLLTLIIMQKT